VPGRDARVPVAAGKLLINNLRRRRHSHYNMNDDKLAPSDQLIFGIIGEMKRTKFQQQQ